MRRNPREGYFPRDPPSSLKPAGKPSGTRIITGAIIIKPWERALKRNGIGRNCLISRTLNQQRGLLGLLGKEM